MSDCNGAGSQDIGKSSEEDLQEGSSLNPTPASHHHQHQQHHHQHQHPQSPPDRRSSVDQDSPPCKESHTSKPTMSLKENSSDTTPGRTPKVRGGKASTTHSGADGGGSSSSENESLTSTSKMDASKTTKSSENGGKRSHSRESKGGSDDSKGKGAKDAKPSEKSQAGVLTDGFCGFEEAEPPVLTRSTREASRNATAILTKKSTARLEKGEGKSDSPPDLVLFLKEGKGRGQNYSDPPRLDPESIATRRRTRMPEDPVALVSKGKSTEKTKKDPKESAKKEKKTKVMETPESLKKLAREGGRVTSKENCDSGSEEKTLKKTVSKGVSESEVKVKSVEGSEEKTVKKAHSKGLSERDSKVKLAESSEEKTTKKVHGKGASESDGKLVEGIERSVKKPHSKGGSESDVKVKVVESSEEKTVKKTHVRGSSESDDKSTEGIEKSVKKSGSKGTLEGEPKVKCLEALSGSEEEQPASTTRRSIRMKRNSTEEREMEAMGETVKSDSSGEDSLDAPTSYSNLGTILNKMSKNNAERRIPVVIMSKSEKKAKADPAKPRSKKKALCDEGTSPAVLKIASASTAGPASASTAGPASAVVTVKSSCKDVEFLAEVEGIAPKPEDDQCESKPHTHAGREAGPSQDVIVVKVTSDSSPEGRDTLTKSKDQRGHASTSSEEGGGAGEKVPLKESPSAPSSKDLAKTDSVSSTVKEGEAQVPVFRTVQGSPSPTKVKPVSSPVRSGLVQSPIKQNLIISSVTPNTGQFPIRPKPLIAPSRSSAVISSTVSSPSSKSGTVPSPLKLGSVMSPKKFVPATSLRQTGPAPSSSRQGQKVVPITSSPQGQKIPPFLVSMSQIVPLSGVKGSVKMANYTANRMGLVVSSGKGTTPAPSPKRDSTPKLESHPNTPAETDLSVEEEEPQESPVSTQQGSHPSPQKGPVLDYIDIETEEVVLGENEDSNSQVDGVGDLPAEVDATPQEELVSSSEDETFRAPERSAATKKELLSPEGRVALDHSYSSGGSGSGRKKSPNTYEKSLTPRPVYGNASTAKRSLDIMLHNDKINILRQMSQIFNDEKPPLQIFSDENAVQSEADILLSSSDGEDEVNVCTGETKETDSPLKRISQTSKSSFADCRKATSSRQASQASSVDEAPVPSQSQAEAKPAEYTDTAEETKTSLEGTSDTSNLENGYGVECTPPMKGRKEFAHVGSDSPFLGFPDPDPKVHHVPAYSLAFNEKIQVQRKMGPAGETIDIVDGFSFTSFATEAKMMSYDGACGGKTVKTHHHWLKKKRKRRKRFWNKKVGRPAVCPVVCPAVPRNEMVRLVRPGVATSPMERSGTADSGAFASDDLDTFLNKNSRLNISYQIPKCKVTEEGVSKIDEEEMLEPSPASSSSQTLLPHPLYPPSASPAPHTPLSPLTPQPEVESAEVQVVAGVNPNTSALEQQAGATSPSESVDQYEEVNAMDILYPKEKYKYYYNKELCKETKADASDVFVRRAGKLVPLSTVLKSQKPAAETSTKEPVDLVYIYDGGKLLTLGGSLTKINPSNSDSVKARVVLPIGVPPIPRGETVASRTRKVEAVKINEEMAKFALSALQSPNLKAEEKTVDKKEETKEEFPPTPGSSSDGRKDEKMEVDVPEKTPMEKAENVAPPKAIPVPAPVKPTKTNILDIIAAKLAMSDEESDEKEEANEEEAASEVKETRNEVGEASGHHKEDATKLVTAEEKEEKESGKLSCKEENTDEIDVPNPGTKERLVPFIKQEDLEEEEKSGDAEAVKPQNLEEGEVVEVKQEKQAPSEVLLSDDVDKTPKEDKPQSSSAETTDVVGKENKSEVLVVKEISKISEPEQVTPRSPVCVARGAEEDVSSGPATPQEKEQDKDTPDAEGEDSASDGDSEKKAEGSELLVKHQEEKEALFVSTEDKNHTSKTSEKKDDESEPSSPEEEREGGKLLVPEMNKGDVGEEGKDVAGDVMVLEEQKQDTDKTADNAEERSKCGTTTSEEGDSSSGLQSEVVRAGDEAEVQQGEDSTLNGTKTVTETPSVAPIPTPGTSAKPPSETSKDEAQGNTSIEDTVTPPQSVVSVPNADASSESLKSSLVSSLESDDKTDPEEKEESSESAALDTLRMELKSRVFKKNMYRFPSLSREMKRLNMNFVNYEPPPQETTTQEKEEEVIPEVKGECMNEYCQLGCVCDSLLCQRRNVEHCGRLECMFECTCRDESWKLPSGSGRTMNAVSIFNLDREQKEGLALREKDFKRTVIQTGSEVILVGAERKKREIRLPGRYRETTVWTHSDFVDVGFESPLLDFPEPPFQQQQQQQQPDYPGIPLSEASKYIKDFKLNIPWYDIKGISVWCMDHSCYDCRCLTDPTFNDPIKVESPRKRIPSKVRPESTQLKASDEPSTSTLSALLDFEEALKLKSVSDDASSVDGVEEKKVPIIIDANCSIMNIIVNNSEARRKYTWKLKEWYHCTEEYTARTAGYSKSKVTEETKNMTLTGLAARDTTPEQIVESVVRSLRQQKSSDEIKLPTLPPSNNFEPFMGDSLINLQNAIGFNPDKCKKPTKSETPCPVVDLTSNEEVVVPKRPPGRPRKYPLDVSDSVPSKAKRGAKRKLCGSVESLLKRAHLTLPDEETRMTQAARRARQNLAYGKEPLPDADQTVSRRTLSLLEMMVAEENRGELELDLSENVPGNALLVAEARFRKLINMNIIGVIGINKAGRCIIGTVDSDEALLVMHQIQNMIRNNTLDVGPNMREIFFPPPYVGIRPRYVMIRCDSHRKWEIVGVVQKKGPLNPPNKASDAKGKANSPSKSQVPQVIDLEEEEREKQMLALKNLSDIKQEEQDDMIEPPSPEERDSGAWEGSLPLIASVHSASDSNMAELIGSPEASATEEQEEVQVAQVMSPRPQTLPDLVRISSSSSVESLSHGREPAESVSMEGQAAEEDNASQPKLYFVPTGFSTSSSSTTTSTCASVGTDSPMKSIVLNVASNKVFGDNAEKPSSSSSSSSASSSSSSPSSKQFSYGKVSYILPKLPGSGKIDASALLTKQRSIKSTTFSKAEEGGAAEGGQASSSKMLYIPVTTGCVSKVLLVPAVSSGSSRMMLLPALSTTSSQESGSTTTTVTTTATSTTTTSTTTSAITTPITSTASPSSITTSKMKMVLMPSPQDGNSKMILIPAGSSSSDSAAAAAAAAGANSVTGASAAEGERKKMLVLPSSVINNFMSRSSEASSGQPHQQSCTGTFLVPLSNAANLSNTPGVSEREKSPEVQQVDHLQDNSDDVVVLSPGTDDSTVTKIKTSEPWVVKEEISHLPTCVSFTLNGGTAVTNVVSSVTTISSTMQQNASLSELDGNSNSETPTLFEQLGAGGLNTFFDKTHEDMLTGAKSGEENTGMRSDQEEACGSETIEKESSQVTAEDDQNSLIVKTKDAEDPKKQLLIKKGGFHWSAVDLSLNFKSVKLEWLLGTIRKNVLMNIYQMSRKTQSPVTLSVKNGTSTSMLYGFARTCNSTTLPILILGSVVSAVLSSSSVPDSMLFQINSIKYFIRESTGELSSYTYSSETHLVKLASKKRGVAGEMVGVGDKIEIYKLRDPVYQSEAEKTEVEAGKSGHSETWTGDSASVSSSKRARMENRAAQHSGEEGATSRLSLKKLMQASTRGFQDITTASEYQQERNLLQVNSKAVIAPRQLHSELHEMLTKSKDQSHSKKLSLATNTEGLGADSNEGDSQATAGRSAVCDEGKIQAEGRSSPTSSSVLHQLGLDNVDVDCESGDEGVDVDVMGDMDSSRAILKDLRQQLEHETTQAQKLAESSKRKMYKAYMDGQPMKKLKTVPGVSAAGGERPSTQPERSDTQPEKSGSQLEGSGSQLDKPCPRSKKMWKRMKPRFLTLEDKVKVLDRVDAGASMQSVCAEFNLGTSTFYTIKKKRNEIRQRSQTLSYQTYEGRKGVNPAAEATETTIKQEPEEDLMDLSSRRPSHPAPLPQRQPSSSRERRIVLTDETDSSACVLSNGRISIKQSQLMAALYRSKQKVKMVFDGEGHEERNTEAHNRLERMRRRVMRHLFTHLQRTVCKIPGNPLISHNLTHAKKTVLCAGQKVCGILRGEEDRLLLEEEKVRSERGFLIKRLAGIIGESTDEIKVKWRTWVKEHMQNPTAKQVFESTWEPHHLMEDLLKNVAEENNFDVDYDEGSPLPGASPVPGPSSTVTTKEKANTGKIKRHYGRGHKKGGKKLGRPHKIVVNTGFPNSHGPDPSPPLPTSILLMAGTSSRGRKIVRKEDTNFVTS